MYANCDIHFEANSLVFTYFMHIYTVIECILYQYSKTFIKNKFQNKVFIFPLGYYSHKIKEIGYMYDCPYTLTTCPIEFSSLKKNELVHWKVIIYIEGRIAQNCIPSSFFVSNKQVQQQRIGLKSNPQKNLRIKNLFKKIEKDNDQNFI